MFFVDFEFFVFPTFVSNAAAGGKAESVWNMDSMVQSQTGATGQPNPEGKTESNLFFAFP